MPEFQNSEGFDPKIIKQAINGREGPFMDAKGGLYRFNVDGNPVNSKQEEKTKATCVKHIIAFANIARRSSKPCYMVFGVDDTTRTLKDVCNQYVSKNKPDYWENPATPITKKQDDGVEAVYRDIASDWIEPFPQMQLEYGVFDGFFVSYLKILPEYPSTPYHLKKQLGGFAEKTTFSRYGSSTVQIQPEEVCNLLPASQFVYIEPARWRDYITNLKSGEFLKSKDRAFFPIRTIDGVNAKERILELLENNSNSIAVSGPAGQGKTTLMQQLTCLLAEHHDLELPEFRFEFGEGNTPVPEDTVLGHGDIEQGITRKIPFHMDLRRTFSTMDSLDKQVCKQLHKFLGITNIRVSSQVFQTPGIRWVIFLDGVDEIRNRVTAGAFLGEWTANLPENVQVVVASRPYAKFDADDTVELDSLHPSEIPAIVRNKLSEKLAGDATLIEQALTFLNSNSGLFDVLSNLRGIEGLAERITSIPEELPEIDRKLVNAIEISEKSVHINPSINIGGTLPIVVADDVSSDDTQPALSTNNDDADNNPEERLVLRLADLLEGIFKYQRDLEVDRQKHLTGRDPKMLAEKAFYEARRLAWESNWENAQFDSEEAKAKKRALDWNCFVGFILSEEYPKYRFYAWLADHYLAASYLFSKQNAPAKFRKLSNKINNGSLLSAKKQVVRLYNELCIQNGRYDSQIFIQEEPL